jgi:hypothetical protein
METAALETRHGLVDLARLALSVKLCEGSLRRDPCQTDFGVIAHHKSILTLTSRSGPGARSNRDYEDREGTRREVMQVIAEKVTFLGPGKREERDDRQPAAAKQRGNGGQETSFSDDIPF